MSDLRVGQKLDEIPGLPGTWSVWSHASSKDYGPGAYFVVPEGGRGHAVIRAKQGRHDPFPTITVLSEPGATS